MSLCHFILSIKFCYITSSPFHCLHIKVEKYFPKEAFDVTTWINDQNLNIQLKHPKLDLAIGMPLQLQDVL